MPNFFTNIYGKPIMKKMFWTMTKPGNRNMKMPLRLDPHKVYKVSYVMLTTINVNVRGALKKWIR